MIIADSLPLWPGELTAWGTLAVAVAAVAVALFAEWRAGVRVRSERQHAAKVLADGRKTADERLTRQLAHSDQQLADERKAADVRLQAQMAHADHQLRDERQQAQETLQLSEAYALRVLVAQQDGRITDPHINANPEDVLRSMVVVVYNESNYTVTDVAVGLFTSEGGMTEPVLAERIRDYILPEGAIDGAPRDLGGRTLAPKASGLRFAGRARLEGQLEATYPIVRWTDHWGQMWEHSKGRVHMQVWPRVCQMRRQQLRRTPNSHSHAAYGA